MRKTLILSLACILLAAMPTARAQKVCAHRGFWNCKEAQHAQNSITSLRLAQENGFWGSEFDVHLTADSLIVVNHDPSLNGIPIATSTYKQLLETRLPNGETIPTLQEYLDQGTKSSCVLVLEIKPQATVEKTLYLTESSVEALKSRNLMDPARVVFISFSYDACVWIAKNYPDFDNQYLGGDKTPEELHADGIRSLDYHFLRLYLHPDWVKRAHDLGMNVNAWTVDSLSDMRKLKKMGVDIITTNKPLKAARLTESSK